MKKFTESESYWNEPNTFSMEEIEKVLSSCKEIGFQIVSSSSKKEFDPSKVKGELILKHIRTNRYVSIYKWFLTSNNLDLLKDNLSDILFTIVYRDIEDQNYADNYQP